MKTIGNIEVPAIGLGTWEMGGRMEPDFSQDKHWIDIIRKGIELGLTHIDTAEMYGNGHTEELVGEAIKDVPRKDLFITTKVWSTHLKHDDLLRACENSLKRLKIDYVDLYLIHFPNPSVPLQESLAAMNLLVEQKLVKLIGMSNFNRSDLEKALRYTTQPIAANQIEYSLLARNKGTYVDGAENEIIPFCRENNITIIAWRPLGKEKFPILASHPVIQQICNRYKASPAQIALAWLIHQKGIVTIPKTGNLQHLTENADAIKIHLDELDFKWLCQAFSS